MTGVTACQPQNPPLTPRAVNASVQSPSQATARPLRPQYAENDNRPRPPRQRGPEHAMACSRPAPQFPHPHRTSPTSPCAIASRLNGSHPPALTRERGTPLRTGTELTGSLERGGAPPSRGPLGDCERLQNSTRGARPRRRTCTSLRHPRRSAPDERMATACCWPNHGRLWRRHAARRMPSPWAGYAGWMCSLALAVLDEPSAKSLRRASARGLVLYGRRQAGGVSSWSL